MRLVPSGEPNVRIFPLDLTVFARNAPSVCSAAIVALLRLQIDSRQSVCRQSDGSSASGSSERVGRACADGEPVLRVERPGCSGELVARVSARRRQQKVADAVRAVGDDGRAASELDSRHGAPPNGLRGAPPSADGEVQGAVVCPHPLLYRHPYPSCTCNLRPPMADRSL